MIEGIYIHIPFCSYKCPYCDFMSFVNDDEILVKRYVKSLLTELSLYLEKYKDFFDVKSIYFGGGTPTKISASYIFSIISYIKTNFKINKHIEITLECNPEDYKNTDFSLLRESGINRISIGNQSFLKKNLQMLGRKHNPEDTIKTIEKVLKAGIKNINLDLIYAVPGQTIKDLEKDLSFYTQLPITHISAYMLTVYDDTQYKTFIKEGKISLPDEDLTSKMFLFLDNFLNDREFKRYELSNWAKEGFECFHNKLYWYHKEFLGVGVSAWSFIRNKRIGNTRNFEKYINMVESKTLPVEHIEYIDQQELEKEKVFLGLRTSTGVNLKFVKNKQNLKYLKNDGYIEIKDNNVILTQKGVMVLNQIINYLT